jgi:hypothetical protein
MAGSMETGVGPGHVSPDTTWLVGNLAIKIRENLQNFFCDAIAVNLPST